MIAPLRRYWILGFMLLSSCLSGREQQPTNTETRRGAIVSVAQKTGVPIYNPGWGEITGAPASSSGGVIILNPENGPIPNDGSFNNDLLAAYSAGIKIFGYIDTVGKPDSGTVNQEINDYYAWYNTIGSTTGIISGIFFDDVPGAGSIDYSYYTTLYGEVKSSPHASWQVALNPGAPVPEEYLSIGDIIVTSESAGYIWDQSFFYSGDPNYATRAWERDPANSARIWHIANSLSDEQQMSIAVDRSRRRNAGLFYAFNLTTNDYGTLASYYADEVKVMNSYNNPGPTKIAAAFARSLSLSGDTTGDTTYSWNSLGGTNSVTHYGPGWYNVTFGGFAASNDVAHVSAIGSAGERCQIWTQSPNGTDEQVYVDCVNSAGAYADSLFSVSLVQQSGTYWHTAGRATCDQPTTPSYLPVVGWTSLSGWPAVNRTQTGSYSVVIPSTASFFGGESIYTCEATPWERQTGDYCLTSSLVGSGSFYDSPGDTYASVNCYDSTGSPADEEFNISCSDVSLNASPSFYFISMALINGAPNGIQVESSLGFVTGDSTWNTSGTVTRIAGMPHGAFYADLPEVTSGPSSNAVVSASQIGETGAAPTYCEVGGWSPGSSGGTRVTVYCFNASGALADSGFVLAYSTNQ